MIAYKYPELLNIYLAPTTQTMGVGMTRVATMVLFGIGIFIYVPGLYFDEEAPTWIIPAAILGSAIPFAAAVASGPMVTSVRVSLPNSARRSREELLRFANNTPPNTRLRLQFIRFAPWLVTRDMYFSDFRRMPKSWRRLSNLENVAMEKKEHLDNHGWRGRLVSRYFNRYWVNVVTTAKDRSRVPGVWEKMWAQIPYVGEDVAVVGKGERRPVSMQNRAVGVQQPPPPRPGRATGR